MPADLAAVPEVVLDDGVCVRVGCREQGRGRKRIVAHIDVGTHSRDHRGGLGVGCVDRYPGAVQEPVAGTLVDRLGAAAAAVGHLRELRPQPHCGLR